MSLKKGGKILIVDDHKNIIKALIHLLEPEFESVIAITNPNQLPHSIRTEKIDVVLLDMNFSAGVYSGNEGLFWLNEILKYDPGISVLLITAYGDISLAVKATKAGATDFILKPWDNDKLIATIKSALKLRKTSLELSQLKHKQEQINLGMNQIDSGIIGNSNAMKKIFATIKKVAKTDANILILGENGSGKELVAREIHKLSTRSSQVFVNVDMGALSETLFESEMFGHLKGSFTDAKEDKIGRFELASGGSLFLDEISNLSVSLQSKLLQVLQRREVIRVGATKAIPFDIRLISASNKNMNELISSNLFREDLYYRLNTIEIHVPPLREREGDIPMLTEFFLAKYALKYEKKGIRIDIKAYKEIENYSWPGNVRELQNTIEKAVILSENNIIKTEDLLLKKSEETIDEELPKTFSEIEKQAIERALDNNRGSVSKAAQELNLSRQTLYNKILKYQL